MLIQPFNTLTNCGPVLILGGPDAQTSSDPIPAFSAHTCSRTDCGKSFKHKGDLTRHTKTHPAHHCHILYALAASSERDSIIRTIWSLILRPVTSSNMNKLATWRPYDLTQPVANMNDLSHCFMVLESNCWSTAGQKVCALIVTICDVLNWALTSLLPGV
jgi:hypothetical protein